MSADLTIARWLKSAIEKLSKESGTARLDAEVMLAHVLKVDRSWLHAHPEESLTTDQLGILNDFLGRRIHHEPLAYILNKTEFYGRDFYIKNGVLVPRPESETLIDMCTKLVHDKKLSDLLIIDVGCGSGALGITAGLELENAKVVGVDIDTACLEVSKINADKHGVIMKLINSNLLENVVDIMYYKNTIVIANLPYVPESFAVNASAMTEPKHAIFGGPDGLSLYRKLFEQLEKLKPNTCYILTESLPPQHTELKNIAHKYGCQLVDEQDFIQLFFKNN